MSGGRQSGRRRKGRGAGGGRFGRNGDPRRRTQEHASEGRNGNSVPRKRPQRTGPDPSDPVRRLIEKDEEEIAYLERKMGLKDRRKKAKLNKEYALHEGFGDDFGDFLDRIDAIATSLVADGGESSGGFSGDSADPSADGDSDRSSDGFGSDRDGRADRSDSDGDSLSSGHDSDVGVPDHEDVFTYRPNQGEDIYGRTSTDREQRSRPSAYVPPHMRNRGSSPADDTEDEAQANRIIQSVVTRSFNRLSADTLASVSQEVARLYEAHPTGFVANAIWSITKNSCVDRPMLMDGLVPVFVACLVAVHLQTRDTVQLAGEVFENSAAELWKLVAAQRSRTQTVQQNDDGRPASDNNDAGVDVESGETKRMLNLLLIVCYMYNYGSLHCSFMYDIIRDFLNHFTPIDIECLLLTLNHAGSSLRSDDPTALKEIVLIVKDTVQQKQHVIQSARAEYMVNTIMDLKNNKRSSKLNTIASTVSDFRKHLGRIKSQRKPHMKQSDAALRISLRDVLDADKRGRWWKVGASWAGQQASETDEQQAVARQNGTTRIAASNAQAGVAAAAKASAAEAKLLRMAKQFRMNSEAKRQIFCIIMGASDCEDAFEKLCRNDLLQNRNERDVVRVVLECCGREKSYNNYYGHLAARICEYQPQSRFSLQLAFWDAFKGMSDNGLRYAANLAKLSFHVSVVSDSLKLLNVIKPVGTHSEQLSQVEEVFLTVLLTAVFEYFDDPSDVKALFAVRSSSSSSTTLDGDNDNDDRLRGVSSVVILFLVRTLKKSPKNVKGSKFRANMKAAVKSLGAK